MMAEGIFRLKETDSGWRHYIELPNGVHDDIHCGSALEVYIGRWEERGGEKLVRTTGWTAATSLICAVGIGRT